MKSINIFGITGGIGSSFIELLGDKGISITGYYHSATQVAALMERTYPNVHLVKVDLSKPQELVTLDIPNHEGILYLPGIPHFSANLFDFEIPELCMQIDVNLTSLLSLLKISLGKSDPALKKVVIVISESPRELKSIYHLTKSIQEHALTLLKKEFVYRRVSMSAIKVGWVDTRMYKRFVSVTGESKTKVLSPNFIASLCINEFSDLTPFRIVPVAL